MGSSPKRFSLDPECVFSPKVTNGYTKIAKSGRQLTRSVGLLADALPRSKWVNAVEAKCPRAENPIILIRDASSSHSLAFARTVRMARWASSRESLGKVTKGIKMESLHRLRNSMPKYGLPYANCNWDMLKLGCPVRSIRPKYAE